MSGVGALEPTDGHRRPVEVMCEVLAKGMPPQGRPTEAEVKEAARAIVEVHRVAGRDRVLTDDGFWVIDSLEDDEVVAFAIRVVEEWLKSENHALRWMGDKVMISGFSAPDQDEAESVTDEGDGPALPR